MVCMSVSTSMISIDVCGISDTALKITESVNMLNIVVSCAPICGWGRLFRLICLLVVCLSSLFQQVQASLGLV